MTGILENFKNVTDRIAQAAYRVGRDPEEIQIVAVSKNQTVETIREGVAAGIKFLGENRVQELLEKYEAVKGQAQWHFIGHLQNNKVKYIVDKVNLIHSLDSLSLAEELNKRAIQKSITVKTLVQVNVSREDSKFGIAPEEAAIFLKSVSESFSNVEIVGLMTIAPWVANPEEVRPVFRQLKVLADSLREKDFPRVTMDCLSMGMTDDFEVAVEEGSNCVRIGRAIFGMR